MAAPLSGALELTGIYWVTHGLSRVLQGEAPPCLPLPRRSTFPLCAVWTRKSSPALKASADHGTDPASCSQLPLLRRRCCRFPKTRCTFRVPPGTGPISRPCGVVAAAFLPPGAWGPFRGGPDLWPITLLARAAPPRGERATGKGRADSPVASPSESRAWIFSSSGASSR